MRLAVRSDCSSCGSNFLRGLRAAWGFYTRPVHSPQSPRRDRTGETRLLCQGRTGPGHYRTRLNSNNPGTSSLNAIAARLSSRLLRAWREPGEGFPVLSRFARFQVPQASHCLFKVARRKLKMSAHLFVQFPASFVCASPSQEQPA